MNLNMTEAEDTNGDVNVTYRIKNKFADNNRFIYFISDPPHLIKTQETAFHILVKVPRGTCGTLINIFCGTIYETCSMKI